MRVHPGFALPLQVHRKGGLEAVILRAVPRFGASRGEAYSFVSVRQGAQHCAPSDAMRAHDAGVIFQRVSDSMLKI